MADDIIQSTKNYWQPYYKETLTDQEAIEINNNIMQLGKLAIRWSKNVNQNKNNVVEFNKG